ncbi:MAG: hypothetical protein RIC19_17990 [Phaeodactylibacter sp.]|uniref:hypothetical protein n=1 Tax=Phaeodactylibacter sp. TaxID=1940289 RepID=UPI0032EF0756
MNTKQKILLSALLVLILILVLPFLIRVILPIDQSPQMDDCEVPDIFFMCDSLNQSEQNTLSLKNELLIAAKDDLELLDSEGKLSNESSIADFYASNRHSQYCVSKDFFEAYKKKRGAICTYLNLLKNPNASRSIKIDAERDLLQSIIELGSIESSGQASGDEEILEQKIEKALNKVNQATNSIKEDSKKVKKENQRMASAILENCDRIKSYIHNDLKRLERSEISEDHFWKRLKELEREIEEYRAKIKEL